MPTFVAVYEGESVGEARIKHLSCDPRLIEIVAHSILLDDRSDALPDDPVLAALEAGRRQALRLICAEARRAQKKFPLP